MAKTPSGARTDSDSRPGDSADNASQTRPLPPEGEAKAQTVETLNEVKPPEAEKQPVADEQKPDPLLDPLREKQDSDATVAPGTDRADSDNKISVITGGQYMYQDPYTLEVVDPGEEPTSITKTTAVENALIEGRLIEAV